MNNGVFISFFVIRIELNTRRTAMPYLKFENLIKNTPLLSDFFLPYLKKHVTPLTPRPLFGFASVEMAIRIYNKMK
jgi:hypothetical protein